MQIVDLNSFDLIAIEGEEAKKFLQGQLTCDVNVLSASHSLAGAICNIKGRVVSDFRLLEYKDTCYLLVAAGMADIVKPVLDKYMVFSRAGSRLANSDLERLGIMGELDTEQLQSLFNNLPEKVGDVVIANQKLIIRIPGLLPRYEIWQFNSHAPGENSLQELLQGNHQLVPGACWEVADIQAGYAHITPTLSEQHLPEALNYDLNGLVSFTKGCYTGQEIVARMYYRGSAKKRLYCGVCRNLLEQPVSIHYNRPSSQQQAAGELIHFAQDPHEVNSGWFVLAVLPTAIEEPGVSLYLNEDPQHSIELRSLPYMTD